MEQGTQQQRSTSASEPTGQTECDVASHAVGWLKSVRSRFHVVARLAVAEAKLAAVSAATVCLLVLLATLFVLSAWGLVVAGFAIAIVQSGVSIFIVLPGLALLHILIAMLLAKRAATVSEDVGFAATRRQFVDGEA